MNRGITVFLDQFFADNDGVLEIVPAPWHECHEHVLSEGQFAEIGCRTIGDHLSLLHLVSDADNGFLVYAGVLVGAVELCQLVRVDSGPPPGILSFHDNARRINTLDKTVPLRRNDGAGIPCRHSFHPCSDQRRLWT